MIELGITLYPEKSNTVDMIQYLRLCKQYGFTYLYLNTLSNDDITCHQDAIYFYKDLIEEASKLEYKIMYDVAPRIFKQWGISYDDLSLFQELKAYGIRIDQPFSAHEEALMSCNSQNIVIELQMDNNTHYIDTIMDYMPIKRKLSGSHNFYPRPYTGLSYDQFLECNNRFTKYGIPVTAYVTSQSNDVFCQWPTTTKGVSLESHRNLSLTVQIKDFISMQCIDRIIISNCYASESELKEIVFISLDVLCLKCKLYSRITKIEKKIVTEELHFCRGDQSEYNIRSTQSRVKYKKEIFPLYHAKDELEVGDIVIESSEHGMYAGELSIILKPVKNSGKSNVVGTIVDDEIYLLKRIKPWQKFRLYQ